VTTRSSSRPAAADRPTADVRLGDDQQVGRLLAQAAEAPVLPMGDMLFQRLLRHRIIFLGQQVDDDLANRICAELILLAAEDNKRDITLYINSPGGSVYAGMAIYDVMQYVPNDVATYAMGMAASMGQFLLTAGAQGKRYAMPHAAILMHQPHGGIGGTATDIRIQAEQSLYLKRLMAERIAMHAGKPVDQIEADSDRDRWFTAEEAKDYGLVDHVVRNANELADPGPLA
jgi:ATP-dependent Clp protease, protease subunit